MLNPIFSGLTTVKSISKTTVYNNFAVNEPISHTTAYNDLTVNNPLLQGPSLLVSGIEEESVTGSRD